MITNDLQRSGLFAPINPQAFIEKVTNTGRSAALRRLAHDQRAGAGHRPHHAPAGRPAARGISIVGRLCGQQLDGKQYFSTQDNWRRIGHIISDAIYERLTGEKGYFDTRIVFIDESGPKQRRIKRLAIMDQDGANIRYLTRGDDLVLTPRFNPSRRRSPIWPTARASRASIF